jgi:Co/Zn/Cd efflux system component
MRRVVRLAAILNLTYFGVEFGVALAIGSVSLFADSIDFLEDTAVNFQILLALDWGSCIPYNMPVYPGALRVAHHLPA